MATPDVDFRVSNDQAWLRTFSILIGTDAPPPWAVGSGTPAWTPLTPGFGPGMARTFGPDLYMTEPGTVPPTFTSASTFAGDVDANGAPRWRRYGAAAAYGRKPYPLAGVTRIVFGIVPCTLDGTLISDRVSLRASSDDGDGTFTITDLASATVRLAVPQETAFTIAPGLYRHGIYGEFSDARGRQRLRTGFFSVERGIPA